MTIFLLVWVTAIHLQIGHPWISSADVWPSNRFGVSPIVKMPQWRSRQWLPWDAPRHQKVALSISLPVAPMTTVRYDFNGSLPTCLRFIVYQQYLVIVYWCFFVNLIWYLYLFWLDKQYRILSLSLVCEKLAFIPLVSHFSHILLPSLFY